MKQIGVSLQSNRSILLYSKIPTLKMQPFPNFHCSITGKRQRVITGKPYLLCYIKVAKHKRRPGGVGNNRGLATIESKHICSTVEGSPTIQCKMPPNRNTSTAVYRIQVTLCPDGQIIQHPYSR